jgi:hypothetical protein
LGVIREIMEFIKDYRKELEKPMMGQLEALS